MKIAFRTDASAEIGAGHVARCMTLALALRSLGCDVLFLCRAITSELADRLAEGGIGLHMLGCRRSAHSDGPYTHSAWLPVSELEDAQESLEAIKAWQPDWMIVDHYGLARPWELLMRSAVENILVIDDLADRPHDCEILTDSTIHDDKREQYLPLVPQDTVLLVGPQYAILRPEFLTVERKQNFRSGKRTFVCFGAYDNADLTSLTLHALELCEEIECVEVVLGASAPHLRRVREIVKRHSGWKLHVQPKNVAELMSKADFAIGAAGQMTFERAVLGLPSLAMAVADNQKPQMESAAGLGILRPLPAHRPDVAMLVREIKLLAGNTEARREMSVKAAHTVDGKGVQRICKSMFSMTGIKVRTAQICDSEMIYAWRTDPRTTAAAYTQSSFSLSDHKTWFEAKLASPNCLMLIAEAAGVPCGAVRFDMQGAETTISIFMAPSFIGYGLGERVLKYAELQLKARFSGCHEFKAHVLDSNRASQDLFRRSGYQKDGEYWTKSRRTN